MAFDIARLSNAVNKYLNSISDVAITAKKASQEIEAKTGFATELKDAIRQNIQARTRDEVDMPDIAARVKAEVTQATGGIDSQIQQINGSFEAIREAGAAASGSKTGSETGEEASSAKADSSLAAAAALASNTTGTGYSSALATALSNYDAYKGTLGTEALQELSRSQYFSSNLIQSALFSTLNQDENGTSGSNKNSGNAPKSAFDSLSLSDINMNSLLQASGLATTGTSSSMLADALTNAASVNASSESSNAAISDSGDLAKALIKAYSANGSSLSATSIFGDFSL